MIVWEPKHLRSNTWDLQLRVQINENINFANDPAWGARDLHDIKRALETYMKERPRDSHGAMWMFYRLIFQSRDVLLVEHLNIAGEVDRTVGFIRKVKVEEPV